MKPIKLISLSILLALLLSLSVPAQAQETADCKIDLSEVSGLITQAQSKSSAGDASGALALLDKVQQKLDEIEKQCGTIEALVPDKFYVDPSGTFTVNYPVGWIVQSLADTPDEQKKSQPILFASDPAVFDMISDNKAGINARGVVVYVGNSKDLMDQLGARNVSQPVDPLNAKTLLATIIANQSSDNGRFGALIQGRAIRDYATAEAPFSVSSQESKPVADGAILMMQLGADKFAVFVGVAPPGDGKSISALARAMAETLQAPPKVMVN